jgi:flagella basal body P-ring formation protein FlgA
MKTKTQLISWLAIFIILLFSAMSQAAQTLDHDDLKTVFTDLLFAEVPWNPNDLALDSFICQPPRVTVPSGEITYTILNQIHPQYLGSKTLSVMLQVDGKPIQKLKMHGVLNLYDEVVVTSHRLRRNSILSEDDLTMTRCKVTGFAHQLIPSIPDAVGLQLSKTLGSGAILLTRYVKRPPLVLRGDLVTIIAKNKQLTITAQGEAKSKGAKGDMVKIKNLASRRIISAKVIGQGLVEVEF